MKRAVVLFAHGARDPEWSAPFRAIQRKVAARSPDITVEVAFLEMSEPSLRETLGKLSATGHTHVTVAPMFMAQGGHLKRDIPRLLEELRAAYPGIELRLLPAVGEVNAVLDAITDWVADAANATSRPDNGDPS